MLRWAAGFFDGEGYITIYKEKSYLRMAMGINHTEEVTIKRMQKLFGGNVYILMPKTPATAAKPYKKQYCWKLYSQHASIALLQLYPYLQSNKKQQADVAIHFQSRLHKLGRVGYGHSDVEYAVREAYAEVMKELKDC